MFDSLINYLDKFGPELLVIQFGFLVILSTLFLWLWFSNRRKYHNLKHAIPANVVKNYLDSIIQNSTALKSSLFRGGGLEVGGVPSVMPLQNLMGGDGLAVTGAPATALLEELNQKKAHIASLEAQLGNLQNSLREIEAKLFQSQANLVTAEARIKELEALLAKSGSGSGAEDAIKSELTQVTRDRDEIRDRLKEFEIIADDLANLKRLQQENEQLKRSLSASQGSLRPVPAASDDTDVSSLLDDFGNEEHSKSEDNSALEEFLGSPDDAGAEDDFLAGMNGEENGKKTEKTSEDLLSEFEKMLG
ncbi:MAG TPA: hypothetical protein VNJ01_16800 [Bacteriovoracaceae bacterium]|nr:hypothetical protein [Bacteriovoracaceae bacterium]